jgi:hypothetical protein
MRRREFMAFAGSAMASWPLAGRAQQAGKVPTIGFLGADASAFIPWTTAFVQRLGELGWIDGHTVAIEYRWSEGRPERAAEIAAEFVRLKVDCHIRNRRPHRKTGDNGHPHRIYNCERPGRRRPSRKPGSTGRQHHWTIDAVDRSCRQAIRTLA